MGFSNKYVFNESDLLMSFFLISNVLNLYNYYPWEALVYILGDVVYGGKITDDQDQKILKATINKFICPLIM